MKKKSVWLFEGGGKSGNFFIQRKEKKGGRGKCRISPLPWWGKGKGGKRVTESPLLPGKKTS